MPATPGQLTARGSNEVPADLKTLFAPTSRPDPAPAVNTSATTGRPELPAMTLLGQGNDARTGGVFYQHVLNTDGAAAARLRSMDPGQVEQLAAQGPPRTAQSVLDLATDTRPAQPGTIEEWERGKRIQDWFADSREHPADFDAFAGALPETERAKLTQTFEDNKPGDLSKPGGLSYWGAKGTEALRDFDAADERRNPPGFIPGSWPDRIRRSGNGFLESVPAGLATGFDHLLIQDEARNGNPNFQPLTGESAEHADQRLHPFTQDLKALGQTYSDEWAPILAHNDWSKLGKDFHDDPVGTTARYVPFGPPSAKIAGRLSRVDQGIAEQLGAGLRPRPPVRGPAMPTLQEPGEPVRAAGEQRPPQRAPPLETDPVPAAPVPAESAQGDPARAGPVQAGSAMPQFREPSAGVADGTSAVKALESNDIPAAKRALAPHPVDTLDTAKPATSPVAAATPTSLEPGATTGDAAIKAAERGDQSALAEALAPQRVDTPSNGVATAGGAPVMSGAQKQVGGEIFAGQPELLQRYNDLST